MIDISKNELYIVNFDSVSKDYIPPRQIPFCRPRRCDAFVYILGGGCHYEFSDKRKFTAETGDVLYLSEGSVYKMDVTSRYDFICINFCFSSGEERESDLFKPRDSAKIQNLFYKIWRNNSDATKADKMSIIYRIYAGILQLRKTSYIQGGVRVKIEEAIALMTEDLETPVSIASIAGRLEISEVYFRRLFRSVTGSAPAKFMIDCRVSRAKELLSEDYLTLEEIAERCGFSSLSYFCRIFKANTGMTPGEFRSKLSK